MIGWIVITLCVLAALVITVQELRAARSRRTHSKRLAEHNAMLERANDAVRRVLVPRPSPFRDVTVPDCLPEKL